MAVCENCQVDHDEEFRENGKELTVLNTAYDIVRESKFEDILTQGMERFAGFAIESEIDVISENLRKNNVPVAQGVRMLAAHFFTLGIAMGARSSDFYGYDQVSVTDDQVEAFMEKVLASSRDEREAVDHRQQIIDALRNAGINIDPENVQVLDPSELDAMRKGGDEQPPTPGMYL